MTITLLGVNHRTAPIELRERLHWLPADVPGVVARVLGAGADGAVLLSTCNRIEFYLASAGSAPLAEVWRLASERLGEPVEPYAYVRHDREAARHLFRVAAGLDSMVLGESQIQGQVRAAWEASRGQAGAVLNRLFQTALRVGGRVRAETQLGVGAASVPSASVELAKKIFGRLAGRRALILGSGDMAELAMGLLVGEGVRVAVVAHHRRERAEALAAEFGGAALSYEEAWPLFREVDIVLCSTAAPHAVVVPKRVAAPIALRAGRPLCILDIAVPRDVDPAVGRHESVFLYDLDDLQGVVAATLTTRERDVAEAEQVVAQEVAFFWDWYRGRGVVDAIRALRRKVEQLRDRELERVLRRLEHLSSEDREQVAYLARALTNKFLHDPTVRLRGAVANGTEATVSDVVRYLFDLPSEAAQPEDGES